MRVANMLRITYRKEQSVIIIRSAVWSTTVAMQCENTRCPDGTMMV